MVSTLNKDSEMNRRKFDLRDLNAVANDYESHKNAAKNAVHSSQFQKKHAREMEVKVILIWSPLFNDWNILTFGMNSFKDSGCPETRCEITSDRRRLLESESVLFHVRTLSMLDIPRNRTQEQKWIFFSLEAPPYSRFQGFDFMTNMFNWTMTYRGDSDVVIPYGRILPKTNGTFRISDLHRKWQRKTKMAVWMVSHCSTDGNREKYIDRLRVFVDVDTYGSCGFASCPFNKTDLCMEEFSKQYYFFLGFENAICDDYITEKLFRTLRYDMIPVVFGGGNYSSVAPSRSFVDALSFASPKQLANQMFRIATNFTQFSSYFQWRSREYSDDVPNHCGLCQKLHSESFDEHSVYGDINDWWINKSHCKTWRSESVA